MKGRLSATAFLFSALLLTSCVVSKKDSAETKEGLTTLKTNLSGSVLLIDQFTSGIYHNLYNHRRSNACAKYYSGKVEAVPFATVDQNPKYQDKVTYRYMLVESGYSEQFHYESASGASKTNTHQITNYALLDRQTGKKLDLNVAGVNSDRVFKKAIIRLDHSLKGS